MIVVLAMLVTIYHHSYDCIIVAVSMVAMLLNSRRLIPSMPGWIAVFVGLLLAVPLLNYVSTRAVRDKLGFEQLDIAWQSITMVNGACLTLAMLIAMYFAINRKNRVSQEV